MPLAAAKASLKTAVASHPDMDATKVSANIPSISHDLLAIVPYLTRGGDVVASQLNEERAEAVEQFKQWKAEEEKNKLSSVAENPKHKKDVPIGNE